MLNRMMRTAILTLSILLLVAAPGAAGKVDPCPAGIGLELPVTARLATRGLALESERDVLSGAAAGRPVGGDASAIGHERKNPMLALLMSFVLPGWGELYTGHTTRAKAFLGAEASIWVGYAAFSVQEGMRKEDYREHAALYADIAEGRDGQYYEDIADYIRSEGYDSYNEAIRADARSLFPNDLEAQAQYLDENGYFGSDSWEWKSESHFDVYRDLRHDAAVSGRNAFYMTGLAVLNRALSGIDSAWMARQHNARRSGEPAVRVSVAPVLTDESCGGRAVLEITY